MRHVLPRSAVPAHRQQQLHHSCGGLVRHDLRAGNCTMRPKVEVAAKTTVPLWSVNGVSRASAHLVSRDAEDRPVYGGIPADFAVVQAIQEMKARGLRVTFYPFLLMDMPPGSTLPNPDSANAATPGQPAFP